LNSCPYRATSFSHHRPRIYDFIEATTILTQGGGGSLPADARRIAQAVRSHWEVENRLHRCLDVQFNEDQSTVRTGFAANNLAVVRHIVMNLLRRNSSRRGSIKTKRMLAATSDRFCAEVLGVMT
jgi:hypothetical protein